MEASQGNNCAGHQGPNYYLFCYHYDPTTGRYGLAILNTLRAAGSATALALGVFIITMLRRDFRGRST